MDTFQAIAEPTRRHIIELLADHGQLSATDIRVHFHVTAPAISQHLKILREAEVVQVEKHAQQRLYYINPDAIHAVESWAKHTTDLWQQRFDALDKVLAQEKAKSKKG